MKNTTFEAQVQQKAAKNITYKIIRSKLRRVAKFFNN